MTQNTTEYLTCADTAKLLRKALKAAHPGVKFSVRSSSYAGGASIDVYWTDGPTARTVDETTQLYTGATFDGMIDLKSYHSTLLAGKDGTVRDVQFGADFIFTHRDLSDGYVARVAADVEKAGRMLAGYRGPCASGECLQWITGDEACWLTEHPQGACSAVCAARVNARLGVA
jgi:hypothetical protein